MAEAGGSGQRVDVGFDGGQVLSVRLAAEALTALQGALAKGGWHHLATEEGEVRIDVSKVAYVRVEAEEHRIGFAGA